MGGEADVLWVSVRANTDEQSFRQMEAQVSEAGDRAGKAGGAGLSGAMGTALSALPALAATAAAAVGAALVGGIKSAVDVAQQARQGVVELQASLGVTGEEAQRLGEVAKTVFGNNWTGSLAEAQAAVANVRREVQGLTDEELAQVSEGSVAIADRFQEDQQKVAAAVQSVMKATGSSAQEALDFITAGFQRGLNSSGDFLDTLNEYGPQFEKAKTTGSELFSLLETGAAKGALGTDKIADSFKEFGFSLADSSEGMTQAFADLGIEQGELTKKIDSGAMTQTQAYQLVMDKLKGVQSETKRMEIMSMIFKGAGEDLGAVAGQIDLTKTKMGDLSGATQQVKDSYNTLGSVFQGAWRQVLLQLQPVGDLLLDLANEAMPAVKQAINTLGPVVTQVVQAIVRGFQQARDGVGPIGQAINAVRPTVSALGDLFQSVFGLISSLWQNVLRPALTAILPVVTTAFGGVSGVLNSALTLISGVVNSVAAIFRGDWGQAWEIFKRAATDAANGLQDTLDGIGRKIVEAGGAMFGKAAELGGKIRDGILNGVQNLKYALASRVTEAMNALLSYIPDWAKNMLGINGPVQMPAKPNTPGGTGYGGTPQPLSGQGPLLPGQQRSTDLGVGMGSKDTIAKMDPEFRAAVLNLLALYRDRNGLQPVIHEGYRSMERQAQLYAQGRTAPGSIVTNAKAGQSIHNYGMAADIYWRDPKTGKIVSFDDPRALEAAKALGQLANNKGLLWGGSPGFGIYDAPHIQANVSWQQAKAGVRPTYAALNTPVIQQPKLSAVAGAQASDGLIERPVPVTVPLKPVIEPKDLQAEITNKVKNVEVRLQLGLITKPEALKELRAIEESATQLGRKGGPNMAAYAAGAQAAHTAIEGLTDATKKAKKATSDALDPLTVLTATFEYAGKSGLPAYEKGLRAYIAQQEKVAQSAKKGSTEQVEAMQNVSRARDLLADATKKAETAEKETDLQREQRQARELASRRQLESDIKNALDGRLKAIIAAGVREVGDGQKIELARAELARREEESDKKAKASASDREKATQDAARREEETAKRVAAGMEERARRSARINALTRAGNIEAARLELAALERQREADLRSVGDHAQARLDVERDAAQKIYLAKKAILDREKLDRDAGIKNDTTLTPALRRLQLANSQTTYDGGLAEAAATRAGRITAAEKLVTDAMQQAAQRARDVEEKRSADVVRAMTERGQAMEKAAQDAASRQRAADDRLVAQMQASGEGMEKAVTANLATVGKLNDATVKGMLDRSAKTFSEFADQWVAAADRMLGDGDYSGAMTALNFALGDLLETSEGSDLAAPALNKLADAIDRVTAARAKLTGDEAARLAFREAIDTPLGGIASPARGERPTIQQPSGLAEARRTRPTPEVTAPSLARGNSDEWRKALQQQEELDRAAQQYAASLEKLTYAELEAKKATATRGEYALIVAQQQRTAQKTTDDLTKANEDFAAAQETVWAAQASLADLLDTSNDGPYQGQLDMLEGLKKKYPELGEEIDALIVKYGQLNQAAQNKAATEKIAGQFGEIGKAVQQLNGLFKKFSGDAPSALSVLGDWMQMNVTAYQQYLSGDVVGAVMTTIEGILNIGDQIANLSPAFREWRKNLLDVADAQKQVANAATGMFKNVYSSALAQDAAARERLGNSKWYERWWWGITGGGPQIMEEGAAKALTEAGQIFTDLAQGLSESMDNAFMNAFETGDWTGTEAAMEKSLNTLLAKMTLKALLAASGMEEKIKAYAEARQKALADGVIDTTEQSGLDALWQGILAGQRQTMQDWQQLAPTLPGYGQNGNPAGSIAAMQQEISRLQEQLSKVTTDAERSRLRGLIDAKQKELDRLQDPAKGLQTLPSGGALTDPSRTAQLGSVSVSTTLNLDQFIAPITRLDTTLTSITPRWEALTARFDAAVARFEGMADAGARRVPWQDLNRQA